MKQREVLKELKAMGTAQNRKLYARHGIGTDMYGVSYANLTKLKKKIKRDHELALSLWASGNFEQRFSSSHSSPSLSTMTTVFRGSSVTVRSLKLHDVRLVHARGMRKNAVRRCLIKRRLPSTGSQRA